MGLLLTAALFTLMVAVSGNYVWSDHYDVPAHTTTRHDTSVALPSHAPSHASSAVMELARDAVTGTASVATWWSSDWKGQIIIAFFKSTTKSQIDQIISAIIACMYTATAMWFVFPYGQNMVGATYAIIKFLCRGSAGVPHVPASLVQIQGGIAPGGGGVEDPLALFRQYRISDMKTWMETNGHRDALKALDPKIRKQALCEVCSSLGMRCADDV